MDASREPPTASPSTHSTGTKTMVFAATIHRGLGPSVWGEMACELVTSRELTWRLFLRDLSARYRQSVLGYLWAVIPVLLTTITFTWLNRTNILPIGRTSFPYPLFLLVSTSVWQLFASGLMGTTQSLVNAGSLITKINFPRETLVLAAFGQSIFEFAVRALILVAAFSAYHFRPPATALLVPLAVLPLCLFTLGLGFMFALANGVMRDAGQLVTSLLTFWMFLTPVVYPPPFGGPKALINVLNPVSPFVIATQDLTSRGYLTRPEDYAIGSVISLGTFLLAWRIFHLAEQRIAERV